MNNFSNLLEKTKYIDFHTHDYTFFDILKQKEQKVFWDVVEIFHKFLH